MFVIPLLLLLATAGAIGLAVAMSQMEKVRMLRTGDEVVAADNDLRGDAAVVIMLGPDAPAAFVDGVEALAEDAKVPMAIGTFEVASELGTLVMTPGAWGVVASGIVGQPEMYERWWVSKLPGSVADALIQVAEAIAVAQSAVAGVLPPDQPYYLWVFPKADVDDAGLTMGMGVGGPSYRRGVVSHVGGRRRR